MCIRDRVPGTAVDLAVIVSVDVADPPDETVTEVGLQDAVNLI